MRPLIPARLVTLLQADGRIFVTPYEYYQLSTRAAEKR